jgi:hypothetical protein
MSASGYKQTFRQVCQRVRFAPVSGHWQSPECARRPPARPKQTAAQRFGLGEEASRPTLPGRPSPDDAVLPTPKAPSKRKPSGGRRERAET